MESAITRFLRQESTGGILLMAAAALAMLCANSPLDSLYKLLLDTPVEIKVGGLEIAKPLLLWVNDGLMAVFFLLVGLELKREFLTGELSNLGNIILPALGAAGGMLVPALIYLLLNSQNPTAARGWAIPTATDIAFALGVLSLLGSRAPASVKIFLTSLAIFDDLGAIIIIAIFYTSNLSLFSLLVAGACITVLYLLNRRGVDADSPYIIAGLIMWVALLKSGVHATLAGVILALFIPMQSKANPDRSPLCAMEEDLHTVVAFFILPLFAFCNAGIHFSGGLEKIMHPIPLGIALGLFLGKQIGIFSFCWLGLKIGIAKLPQDFSLASLYGVAVLCGIGFTMSLFIASLAFEATAVNHMFDERLGIVLGSLASGVCGFLLLHRSLGK